MKMVAGERIKCNTCLQQVSMFQEACYIVELEMKKKTTNFIAILDANKT